jgi:hypothetical protein
MGFPETISPDERPKTGTSPVAYNAELQKVYATCTLSMGTRKRIHSRRSLLMSRSADCIEREWARLHEIVAQHRLNQGAWFNSRVWIISARCR